MFAGLLQPPTQVSALYTAVCWHTANPVPTRTIITLAVPGRRFKPAPEQTHPPLNFPSDESSRPPIPRSLNFPSPNIPSLIHALPTHPLHLPSSVKGGKDKSTRNMDESIGIRCAISSFIHRMRHGSQKSAFSDQREFPDGPDTKNRLKSSQHNCCIYVPTYGEG